MTKKFLFATILLLSGSLAFADNDGEATIDDRFAKNHWSLSADTGAIYDSSEGATAFTNLHSKYFLIDRLALGATLEYLRVPGQETALIGPSLTYHFYQFKQGSLFVSQEFLFGHDRADNSPFGAGHPARNVSISQTTLGLDFFLTQHLALGPRVSTVYNMKTKDAKTLPGIGLTFSF